MSIDHSVLNTSPYIYGMHERCPFDVLRKGWMLHMAELGDSMDPHPGLDLTRFADAGYGAIARLQYSWGGGGTIPPRNKLNGYLQRVRSCVNNSKFCHIWQPFNEPNHPNEWIGGPNGSPISVEYATFVYDDIWKVIHDVPGHELDQVLLPPIAPWILGPNDGQSWIDYYQALIVGARHIDGFAWHTYSRGSYPESIWSEDRMDPPWNAYHNGFRTIEDWAAAVPSHLRHIPAYVTETNQGDQEWLDANSGWVGEAYKYIDNWNYDPAGKQRIRTLILYRWPHAGSDKWHIHDKLGVQEDFKQAQEHRYIWDFDVAPKPPVESPTQPSAHIISVDMAMNIHYSDGTSSQLTGILE